MVDQDRDNLDGALSVYDEITGGSDSLVLGSSEINSRAYCSWFGFKVLNMFLFTRSGIISSYSGRVETSRRKLLSYLVEKGIDASLPK